MRYQSIHTVVRSVRKHGFGSSNGHSSDMRTARDLACLLGSTLQSEESVRAIASDQPNIVMSRLAIPYHNEKLFLPEPPNYLLLCCQKAPSTGGRTLLMDGAVAANNLFSRYPFFEDVLIKYTSFRDGTNTTRPVVMIHPKSKMRVLVFRQDAPERPSCMELVRAPAGLTLDNVREIITTILSQLPPACSHEWSVGDILAFDNFRMLHSREAFTGERVLGKLCIV